MKGALLLIVLLSAVVCVLSSSHSEAPGTLSIPQADVTDVYAFMSYEASQIGSGYITVAALFQPLMNPFAGPNYYQFSTGHYYDILVDNRGSGRPKFTFRFEFANEFPAVPIALPAFGSTVGPTEIPLKFVGPINSATDFSSTLNFQETYTAKVVKKTTTRAIQIAGGGGTTFIKAFDNVGNKTFPDYDKYAKELIYNVQFPASLKCDVGKESGKIFVGPRKDPFYIYLGGVFDLIHFIPIETVGIAQDAKKYNDIKSSNVHAIVIEIHKSCLLHDSTASSLGFWARTIDKTTGIQGSRMGNPLINELFIGIPDKDFWNRRMPHQDAHFNNYLLYPSFPVIIDALFRAGVNSLLGTNFATLEPQVTGGRKDLLTLFHMGFPGLTQLPLLQTASDMLRLNTTIAPIPYASQNSLGLVAGDAAGFPNGRRLKDDIVDIYLRASVGLLLQPDILGNLLFGFTAISQTVAAAPIYSAALIDGVPPTDSDYIDFFPYMANPLPGATGA